MKQKVLVAGLLFSVVFSQINIPLITAAEIDEKVEDSLAEKDEELEESSLEQGDATLTEDVNSFVAESNLEKEKDSKDVSSSQKISSTETEIVANTYHFTSETSSVTYTWTWDEESKTVEMDTDSFYDATLADVAQALQNEGHQEVENLTVNNIKDLNKGLAEFPNLKSISFPDAQYVRANAFANSSIEKFSAPASYNIGGNAFSNCRYLKYVNIGTGIIENNAFSNAGSSSRMYISLPMAVNWGNSNNKFKGANIGIIATDNEGFNIFQQHILWQISGLTVNTTVGKSLSNLTLSYGDKVSIDMAQFTTFTDNNGNYSNIEALSFKWLKDGEVIREELIAGADGDDGIAQRTKLDISSFSLEDIGTYQGVIEIPETGYSFKTNEFTIMPSTVQASVEIEKDEITIGDNIKITHTIENTSQNSSSLQNINIKIMNPVEVKVIDNTVKVSNSNGDESITDFDLSISDNEIQISRLPSLEEENSYIIEYEAEAVNNTYEADNVHLAVEYDSEQTIDAYGTINILSGALSFKTVPELLEFDTVEINSTTRNKVINRKDSNWGIIVEDLRGTTEHPTTGEVERKNWEIVATVDGNFRNEEGTELLNNTLSVVYVDSNEKMIELETNDNETLIYSHSIEGESPAVDRNTTIEWSENTGIFAYLKNVQGIKTDLNYSVGINFELRVAP